MTVRAIALGLLGACFVCGFTYFNDVVMRQSAFVGNYIPIGIFGGLMLLIMVVNPLLARVGMRFSGGELTVMLALTLAAACVPGPGLMRAFTATQILPHHYNRIAPGWQAHGVLDMVPRQMLADVNDRSEDRVLGGFIRGLPRSQGQQHIGVADVPWTAWARMLAYWMPLILSLWVAFIGLALVVHQQWSDHEKLPYPIASFVHSMLPTESGAFSSVFTSRLFWFGAVAVLLIHLNNFASVSFPERMVQIPRTFDLMSLGQLFPTFRLGFTHVLLLKPTIYFTIVAIAYFLASEVSLSLGIGPFLYCLILGVFATFGETLGVGGGYLAPKPLTFVFFGSFLGIFLAMAYMGRRFYTLVFRKAVALPVRASDHIAASSVWGARVFMAGLSLFIVQLVLTGVDWQLAVVYALGLVLIYLVQSRILAETGVFFMRAYWWPCVVMAGFLGFQAMDPTTFLILMLVTTVLALDPREAIMPFMVNSLKMLDLRRVPLGRTTLWCAVALLLGMAIAVPVTLYFQYDRGYDRMDTRATWHAPRVSYLEAIRVKHRLTAMNTLDAPYQVSGWQRLKQMAPSRSCMLGFAIGLGLVGLFSFCRMRLAWWPLHPVLFLLWQNYPGGVMAASFLLGWLIKTLVTKFGGARSYQQFKPLMVGLIAGDLLAGVIVFLVGTGVYATTGQPPGQFQITP